MLFVFNELKYIKLNLTHISMNKFQLQKNTRFLVTGGAGFIGSNIIEHLLRLGFFVRCMDNLSTGNKENIKEFVNNPNFEFVCADIRNFAECKDVMTDIDFVLHEAAWGSVPRSLKEPFFYYDNNAKGFINVLEAAKCSNIKRLIYASSSSIYGNSPSLPRIEGEEGQVLSPYALTKENNEKWAMAYTQFYGIETIGLRYFNVFGKKQNPNGEYAAVIPKFISEMKKGIIPLINGDGLQSRDFTYVDNVVQANILACTAEKKAVGRSYNIASGTRITIHDLYQTLARVYDIKEEPYYAEERTGDIKDSFANIDLAKEFLGYYPQYSFEEGLSCTVKWYNQTL